MVATETIKWKQKLCGAGGQREADLVFEGQGRGLGQAGLECPSLANTPLSASWAALGPRVPGAGGLSGRSQAWV